MPRVVAITSDEVEGMIRRWLLALGDSRDVMGVQIVVEQPFAAGGYVHNEVPGFNVILSSKDANITQAQEK